VLTFNQAIFHIYPPVTHRTLSSAARVEPSVNEGRLESAATFVRPRLKSLSKLKKPNNNFHQTYKCKLKAEEN